MTQMKRVPLSALVEGLEARMRSDFYAPWIANLRLGGASEDEIAKAVAREISEAIALGEGLCPQCNEPSVAYYRDEQRGPSNVKGAWIMFRCSTQPPPGERRREGACDFMLDLKLPLKGAP